MNANTRRNLGVALVAVVAVLAPAITRAGVTRVEISSRQDVLGGKTFGTIGAYEKLSGKVYFAIDPNNQRNKIIADIDKAPRNSQGKVEFSADLFILRPKDPSHGNGVLLFDVPNRGRNGGLSALNRAKASADPATEEEFGDGPLMREGYTVVSVGWEFDIPKKKGLVLLDAPVATDNGKPITGWIDPGPWFIPDKLADSYNYASGDFTPSYPPLDLKNPTYRLTERDALVSFPHLVPREDWQFGRVENGQVVTDANWVTMKGGFKPGMVYEGFTVDEQGRKAIDALFIQTGGTGLGSFNERWAQPDELGSYTQTKFPIRYEMISDPVTGKRDGLGARIPAGLEPKILEVDTESEYYDRGRVTSLRHISMDGGTDLPDPPNVRIFLLAGAKHASGSWPPAEAAAQQLRIDPLEYRWAQRALLAALDRWVREGVTPPPSLHPMLADRTAVPQNEIKFPNVPGVQWPYHVPGGFRNDMMAGPTAVLPFLVPRADKDGNVISGLRLPEQSVPLGTYGGWAFRSENYGQSDTLVSMAGSYIPFAKTKAEREKTGDPRLSVEERYSSRADYVHRVEESARKLVQERYLLQEDLAPIVEAAGQHWDWTMNSTTTQSRK